MYICINNIGLYLYLSIYDFGGSIIWTILRILEDLLAMRRWNIFFPFWNPVGSRKVDMPENFRPNGSTNFRQSWSWPTHPVFRVSNSGLNIIIFPITMALVECSSATSATFSPNINQQLTNLSHIFTWNITPISSQPNINYTSKYRI